MISNKLLNRSQNRVLPRARHFTKFRSSKAEAILLDAKQRYESGDKIQALNQYVAVLKENGITNPQVQKALFGATAVHASFGDIELAQMSLRDAIGQGLDFEGALNDPQTYVEIVTSQQILIQLRRFSSQLLKNQEMAAIKLQASQRSSPSLSSPRSSPRATDLDLAALLSKPNQQDMEIDGAVMGIVRRVVILVIVGALLGTALWFIGLEYLFPKY